MEDLLPIWKKAIGMVLPHTLFARKMRGMKPSRILALFFWLFFSAEFFANTVFFVQVTDPEAYRIGYLFRNTADSSRATGTHYVPQHQAPA